MNCRGLALVTGLILLAAVALLAVTAAGSMTLQHHQSANFIDRQKARNHADLAASYAVAWLNSRDSTERQGDCSDGCLLPYGVYRDPDIPDRPEFLGPAWWLANGTASGRQPQPGGQAGYEAPANGESVWIIEEIHFEPGVEDAAGKIDRPVAYYRVFARGRGVFPGSVAVTESIVARPWGEGIQASAFPPEPFQAEFCSQFDKALACGVQSWRQRR